MSKILIYIKTIEFETINYRVLGSHEDNEKFEENLDRVILEFYKKKYFFVLNLEI